MIVVFLFSALFVSVLLHIFYLVRYVQSRNEIYLKRYLITTLTNVLISGFLIYFALAMPREIRQVDYSIVWWLISGFIMVMMLIVQVIIFRRTYLRSKLPEHFHLNFFGKKVLHGSVLKPLELWIFFGTIPFLLLCGAYFVAKLIRYFI